MSTFCINHSDPKYQTLQEMSGINTIELDMLVRPYLENLGELPTIDMILGEADTIQHLKKTYNLKSKGNYFVSENASELDQIYLNNMYRDLEITITPLHNNRAIVDVKRRALPHRRLPVEKKQLPVILNKVQEVQPIQQDGDQFIYEVNGTYYKTNYRITRTDLLVKAKAFNSLQEALNAYVNSSNYLDDTIVKAIQNSKKIKMGYDITVSGNGKLPSHFSLYNDFLYPNFIYNDSINSPYQVINGTININPNYLKGAKDLELFLLKAMEYDDSDILVLLNGLSQKVEYETIADGQNNFIVRQVTKSQEIDDTVSSYKPQIDEDIVQNNSIELVLDRLEELYGIKFNRITTDELKHDNYKDLIRNVYGVHAFILNGEIYINTDNATLDAPIHELSHLLLGCLRQTKPILYSQLVNSVESLPNYKELLSKYPNRTRMDVNEEIFVDLFAKHYVNGMQLDVNPNVLEQSEYEIKRNIDSAIFPNTSVTTLNLEQLMGKSFNEIMAQFGTAINKDTLAKAFNSSDGFKTRYMANLKQRLLENGSLKEYCI